MRTGGNVGQQNMFSLGKFSGLLSLASRIEKSSVVDVVVKATDDCWSGFWEMSVNRNVFWNVSDTSLLLVEVTVMVENNRLVFAQTRYTAGITRDTQYGDPVATVAVSNIVCIVSILGCGLLFVWFI